MYKQLSFTNIIPETTELSPFYWGENCLLEHEINQLLTLANEEKFLYIWGDVNSGKSHLLQYILKQYPQKLSSIYLPMNSIITYSAACLENLEHQHLILIDDIQYIRHHQEWEEGIFYLFNRIRDNKESTLVITANKPPALLD